VEHLVRDKSGAIFCVSEFDAIGIGHCGDHLSQLKELTWPPHRLAYRPRQQFAKMLSATLDAALQLNWTQHPNRFLDHPYSDTFELKPTRFSPLASKIILGHVEPHVLHS